MNTIFVAYKYEEGESLMYFLRINRVNDNDAFDYRSLAELGDDLSLNVDDLYNGEEMTLSFEVPATDTDSQPLTSFEQDSLRDLFKVVKAQSKEHWDEAVAYNVRKKS